MIFLGEMRVFLYRTKLNYMFGLQEINLTNYPRLRSSIRKLRARSQSEFHSIVLNEILPHGCEIMIFPSLFVLLAMRWEIGVNQSDFGAIVCI